VHIKEGHRPPSYFVTYRFLPHEREELTHPPKIDVEEATQPADPAAVQRSIERTLKQMEAVQRWVEQAERRDLWIWGGHRISSALRERIAMRDDRMVTYLPDAPSVNAIGQLTDERIATEWRSNPTFLVAGPWVVLLPFVMFGFPRFRKRREGDKPPEH
jgi:hypothetical protein